LNKGFGLSSSSIFVLLDSRAEINPSPDLQLSGFGAVPFRGI
jgi:hypothetical protein